MLISCELTFTEDLEYCQINQINSNMEFSELIFEKIQIIIRKSIFEVFPKRFTVNFFQNAVFP